MKGKLESTLEKIITGFNTVTKEAGSNLVYGLDIREREGHMMIADQNNQGLTGKRKRVYYGTLIIFVTDSTGTYAIWRQQYTFHNLTDKTSDLLWRERLCEGVLYEALGTFSAVAWGRLMQEKEGLAETFGTYDIENDIYKNLEGAVIPTNPEEKPTKKSAQEISKEKATE